MSGFWLPVLFTYGLLYTYSMIPMARSEITVYDESL